MTGPTEAAVLGCWLGTAVGDAVGLCAEGLSPRRQRRLFPNLDGPHFLFGRGFVSDDTEHSCLTAQALIASAGDPGRFQHDLAWRLRWWLLGLSAGLGKATLKAGLKLWLGFPPDRSGVYSAGNGPGMRAPLLGVCYGRDPARLRELVHVSSRITHTDPRAEQGALLLAGAAWLASQSTPVTADTFRTWVADHAGALDDGLRLLMEEALTSATSGESAEEFVQRQGWRRGVSGFINHTLAVVLHTWLRHPDDLREAVLTTVRCGGDSDTTAAIVSGIVGARVGRAGVPADWLGRIWEWPRTVGWMEELGRRLTEVVRTGRPARRLWINPVGLAVRNAMFLTLVLGHAVRRALPPY